MRITENKRRFGLVVFAALLGIAVSVFSVFGSAAHPAYAGVSGCSQQVNDIQSSSYSSIVFHNGTAVADEYVNIDALVNPQTAQTCGIRARADVFPRQGHVVSGAFRVELCGNTPAVYGCEMGGESEVIPGSGFSYTCPTVGYPNHCAIVGPWVSDTPNIPCPASLDAGSFATSQNSAAEAYAWMNNWC